MFTSPIKQPNGCLYKNLLLKLFIIFITCSIYTIACAEANTMRPESILAPITNPNAKSKGVCVFDIDFTLVCPGSAAAVKVCKDAGFDLAINTARNKADAMIVLRDNTLIKKGFPKEFVDNALKQVGLNGPFQYEEAQSMNQPEEQFQQNKSYGMRNIAKYYNLNTDDVESRKIVLFDDMLHNIEQMQPFWYEGYSKEKCKLDDQGLCHSDPLTASFDTEFPRNWKIYRSKWIGHFCAKWWDPKTAAKDAREMIADVLNNRERIHQE